MDEFTEQIGSEETGENGLLHRSMHRAGPRIFYVVGICIFLAGNSYFLLFNSVTDFFSVMGAINAGFYGTLGAVIVLCGVFLRRRDTSPSRYPRAAVWMLCGVAFLLLLNAPMIGFLANQMSIEFLLGWVMSVVATSSTGGAVVGTVEARSIEQAHLNQHLRTERAAAEYHADQLVYLNSVLRHEVLNNVNIIRGYAKLGLESEDTQEKALSTIYMQSEEMATIITDVQVLIASIQGENSLEARNLSRVLTEELEKVQAKAEVEVTESIPDDISVRADDLLPRVFRNLFSNAIEHNDSPTSRIEVAVEERADTVEVRVIDNGPGIPESKQTSLFESSVEANHGLGLYLVHELLLRYGGGIEIAETGATGTEFKVELIRSTKGDSGPAAAR
ncbi:HAMP domain-containing sensor histidine kinase [Halostagnicola sp. A-GB9-2]|uniref:sensor histidine kinase n=1 Tax=Halostagnicola sp. A-GB9-2 TaxID=3048066 RepID=UPI0024BF4057|nr:HAMP domain-containing sensor histidine kinase [Halostagnicola sp. A-GB9-2]MDJ1434241.1 HAMP domain-containing sensor histidine kinase [Halostagnicola sp. A-GB9-2]